MTILPDRRAQTDRAFRLWCAAKSKREATRYLGQLWELCEPEIERAVREVAVAAKEDSPAAWRDRRGLTPDEVARAAFPAVADAASRYDPDHESGASFSTFAMKYIKGTVARLGNDSLPLARTEGTANRAQEDQPSSSPPTSWRCFAVTMGII